MKAQGHICPACSRSVTCTGADDSVVLTGTCIECGRTYEVTQYTPVPFKGDVDPHTPLMSAPVKGPGGTAHPVLGTDKDSILRGNEIFQEKYKKESEEAQKTIDDRNKKQEQEDEQARQSAAPKQEFAAGGEEKSVDDKSSYSGFNSFKSSQAPQPDTEPRSQAFKSSEAPQPAGAQGEENRPLGGSLDGNERIPTNSKDVETNTPNPLHGGQSIGDSENNP